MLSLLKARLEGVMAMVVLMRSLPTSQGSQVLIGEAKTTVMSTSSAPVR